MPSYSISDMAHMPRRILIFSLVYYPRFIGGAEVAVKEITDRIPAATTRAAGGSDIPRYEFDMVCLRLDSSLPRVERIGNVTVHRVGWAGGRQSVSPDSLGWFLGLNKYAFLLTGFTKACSLHRAHPYDATWSLMATYNSFAAVFFKLTHPRVPFLFTLQDGDPIEYIRRRARPLWPFFTRMFTRADHIQAISRYLADWARDMGARCPIDIVPNGVDVQTFSRQTSLAEKDAAAEELGKRNGDIFLITTSRLVVKNAVGDIISALPFMSQNVKLAILGQGYQEADLRALASRLGVADRVRFMGYVAHADMLPYLAASDVFVRPALSEGLGNSFLEAMAAGIPVVGTAVGGIPDFLTDGETGLVCDVGSPRSIAQKVEKLLRDRESRDYIVTNARRLVLDKYTWEKVAQDMGRIFSQLTNRVEK